jgi:hypothetical protein
MEKSICNIPSCRNYQRYARYCGHMGGSLKEPKPIAKESKERKEINRKEYAPKAAEFVKNNPVCQINSPVCTKKSQCVHHTIKKDSKELLLGETYWKASCFPCNNWIEQNDAASRVQGLKKSKFSIPAKNQKIKRA